MTEEAEVDFVLLAEAREELEAQLNSVGLTLEGFAAAGGLEPVDAVFTRRGPAPDMTAHGDGEGRSNNPFRFANPRNPDMPPVDPTEPRWNGPELGFGRALRGPRGRVREWGLNRLEAFAEEAVAGPLLEAPAWSHWVPGGAFGSRARAERLIGAEALPEGARGVHVAIVDQGFDADYAQRLGGQPTWRLVPASGAGGANPPAEHGPRRGGAPARHANMVLRNVVSLAPGAKLIDAGLVPGRILDLDSFVLRAAWGWLALRWLEWFEREVQGDRDAWVFVNAWGASDSSRESLGESFLTSRDHPLNRIIAGMAESHDVVFAAGNCGQFAPDRRCGPYDAGPGRSVLGPNGLDEVLSVGAVRADGLWIGGASQGPAPPGLAPPGCGVNEKPDLAAPSAFAETRDAGVTNGGTSAACGVAAGAVAQLRRSWTTAQVPPAEMRGRLRESARKIWHADWNGRMGAGVLDLRAAVARLSELQ